MRCFPSRQAAKTKFIGEYWREKDGEGGEVSTGEDSAWYDTNPRTKYVCCGLNFY